MITRDELLEQATAFGLNESNIQRDYVFGWLISGIFKDSALRDTLVLKGGNALRKAYFPGTRFSDDLDLSTEHGIESSALLAELNKVCSLTQDATGIRFDLERNRIADEQQIDNTRRAYKVRLYFKDLIGEKDHITLSVRMDVTEYDRLHLPIQTRQLIHPYSDADACTATIRCIKLEEALADKLKCLLQRRYCYDIFDLVYGAFVSRDIEVDRGEMVQVFLRKTIFYRSPGAAKALLLDLPLDLFRGYWGKVVVPSANRFSFDEAIEKLRTGVEDLFAPLGSGVGRVNAFFPSHLRNLVLQAGSEQRLLRLSYDGVSRVVEPYSLAFKRRQDGVANEYLYVWDRTGGNRSGPGIKALFHNKIRAMELLEETFDPRFAVELGKAGDSSQAGYFAGTGGRRATASTRARRSGSSSIKYVVQCSYCGKQFTRTKSTTRLNAHKDRYGNQCFGRSGYIVRHGY
ncbi:nucleotidyl transferase AbiEii/AbiGii toxin family protein [Kribbella sp. NPDC020789]